MTALDQTIQNIVDVFEAQGYTTPECYFEGKDNNGDDLVHGFMAGLKSSLMKMAENKLSDLEIKKYNDNEKIKKSLMQTEKTLNDEGLKTLANFNDVRKNEYYKTITEKQAILFLGKSGSGKTHIASALCRSLVVYDLETIKVIDFKFFRDVEAGRFDKSLKDMIRKLKSCSVLFFDDIGKVEVQKNGKYNYYGNILLDIFNHRADHKHKKNIITARFEKRDDLFKHCGDDLYRRMLKNGDRDFYKLEKRGE